MASMLVLFLLLFIPFAAVEAQKQPSNLIRLGSFLSSTTPPNSWLSPSGLFAFGFYQERNGFAVGIWIVGNPNKTVVWTANRDSPLVLSNSTIEFTTGGKLILRTEQGTEQTIAEPETDDEVGASASMLDSGNFVLYRNDSSIIWESFDYPTDTILGGQTLSSGDELASSVSSLDHSSGRFLLRMQGDGNLVAYPVNSTLNSDDAYWASHTNGLGTFSLNLTSNGLLYLRNYASNVTLVESSSHDENNSTIYRATLGDDGIFRLYSHHLQNDTSKNVSIMLQDHCQVHGFCGINSYCTNNNGTEAECYCYPGFVFVDQSRKFLGCYRNFSEDLCSSKILNNSITTLENLSLLDLSYSILSMKKEDCAKTCKEDCNCVAALYSEGICKRQKLPLKYGRIIGNNLATAFFKISLATAKIPDQIPNSPAGPTFVTDNKRGLISILAASLGSITCLCFVIAISSFIVYKHRVHKYRKLSDNAKLGLTEEFTLRSFSYDELEKATGGFMEELGKGSYGTVYRGTLSGVNKKVVAVKRLENVLEEGDRTFHSEVTAIGRTHHRNLVRLLGFCVEGSRKLLVYEYVSNGSLADLLFKAERLPSWRDRLRIALDIARGILYLHEECEACIIHCNIKPQNILMDDSFTAKISDFGLAKLVKPNHTQSINGVGVGGGTGSYLPPERQQGGWISVKSDIYSFGVVLLEVICCRRNIEVNVSNADETSLTSWVYKCFVAGELHKLFVDDEKEKVDLKILQRMVKMGLWCIQDDPGLRPPMKKVILMLEGTMDIPVPPNPFPCLLHS